MRLSNAHIVLLTVVSSAIVIALVFLLVSKGRDAVEEEVHETVKAPAFSLPDASGKNFSLNDVAGEIRIINFWASWSPYSAEELRMLHKVSVEYAPEVQVVGLNRDSNIHKAVDFLAREKIGEGILFVFDKNDDYFELIEGSAVPETIFIGKNNEILFHKRGPISHEEVTFFLQQTLSHD